MDPYPDDTDNDRLDNDIDPDDDNDLVLDLLDNCAFIPNTGQTDMDRDGVGDSCDLDKDNDALPDYLEEMFGSDPLNAASTTEFVSSQGYCGDGKDNDLDGDVDAADNGCIDTDGDTSPDFMDNCPKMENHGWVDQDGDGLGNECDPTPRPPDYPPTGVSANGPYTVEEGGSVRLTGSGTDPDGIGSDESDLGFGWDANEDGAAEIGGRSVILDTEWYEGPGENIITLEVVDFAGNKVTVTTTLHILNVAPVIGPLKVEPNRSSADGGAKSGAVGELIASATFTDTGLLDSHMVTWDWGDGTTSSSSLPESYGGGEISARHSYTTAGEYTISLKVTDDDGASGQATIQYKSTP